MKGILCFGDSITFGLNEEQNWCALLAKEFTAQGDHHIVYNLGVPGDTSTDLLKRFDIEADARLKFRWPSEYIIIISIGVNDAKLVDNTPRTSKEQFQQNTTSLLEKAHKKNATIFVTGLTTVNEAKTQPYENTWISNKRIKEYEEIIAKHTNIIPLPKLLPSELYDGLHPNKKGHKKLYKTIRKALNISSL